ncbi:hypothetical protein O181_096862 [Austropuccinia psidii MF-1]|uniref:Uncharacterized protein n=1 Tax=Austropuccinia psidii MF-1 TaxID=1389203 RepID=A0A9Q3J846_9BASI|nr:hypothetical protein [Austropuccinia psidii MF-1]
MSGSTHLKKGSDDDADAKPLSNEGVYLLLNSLQSKVSSLKLAQIQLLHLALYSPPPALSLYHHNLCTASSAYDHFMQKLYRADNQSNHLQNNSSNFPKWAAGLNRVLCIALNSELSVKDCPSLLEKCFPQENRAISHFIDTTLPRDFALCIGVVPACTTAKEFFDAIKTRCFPGNCFQKLKVGCDLLDMLVENSTSQPKPNSAIILTLCRTFAIFKKLGVEANELEGLLAQAACHTPPTLDQVAFDQLVMAALQAKGKEKPLSTFVGQVILNMSQKNR